MATYARETRVDAPLDDVWRFHSTVGGLESLTPSWLSLRVESVRGPDGGRDPEVLKAGTVVRLSMRPFGVGSRVFWTSRITRREEHDGAAVFEDEMMDGPFDRWVHTHAFYADDGGTRIRDSVEYALPFGPLGELVTPFSGVGFEPMFRHRHRRTRELLG